MVSDAGGVGQVKVLCLQDVLQLIHALQSVVHVCRQMAVEEAHHVAVEGKPHGHSSFITLTWLHTRLTFILTEQKQKTRVEINQCPCIKGQKIPSPLISRQTSWILDYAIVLGVLCCTTFLSL